MKIEEIMTALRACVSVGRDCCEPCPAAQEDGCEDAIKTYAADALEKLLDRCARYAEEIAVLQERQRWIPVTERLPVGDDQVLVAASGKPRENIELVHAVEIASLYSDGWCLETWPEWTDAKVTHWMPLPKAPEVE